MLSNNTNNAHNLSFTNNTNNTSNLKYAILSTKHKLTNTNKSELLPKLYASTNWKKYLKPLNKLSDIITNKSLNSCILVLSTNNLLVLDFDTDAAFEQALNLNNELHPLKQCKFIVKSTRKGGHFYYANPDNNLQGISELHTKQAVLDVLTTDKHNILAPTAANETKQIIVPNIDTIEKINALIPIPSAMVALVNYLIYSNLPNKTYATHHIPGEWHSDDAIDFVRSYLAGIITPHQFNQFYGLPSVIPPGMSNYWYLKLSTRLGLDETIDKDTYLQVMDKYNATHGRKTEQELRQQITERMVTGQAKLDGKPLWRYNKNKATQQHTYSVLHKKYGTTIRVYFDIDAEEYLIEYKNNVSKTIVHTKRSQASYIDTLEKISLTSKDAIRRNTNKILTVNKISDYSREHGYCSDDGTYNVVSHNSYLNAFNGAKPPNYETPTKLLHMLEYMWGEEYQYMLAMTKYRYLTFQFSPVITYLCGTEGSGKDITIDLLTRGFNSPPQNLNYQLLKDKHSNWQIEPNAVFSEIGSWAPYEQKDLLAELKTISGSNGNVTFRAMHTTAKVVPTIIKIWVTGNEWIKLHSDPTAQRRIHVVYMPNPLEESQGGKFSIREIEYLLSEDVVQNFYYWLGNECQFTLTAAEYTSAVSRQHSTSYSIYKENVESPSDRAAALIYSSEYPKVIKAMQILNMSLNDVVYKYDKSNRLVVSAKSFIEEALKRGATPIISKTVDRLCADKFDNKRIVFNNNKDKYFILYGAPANLDLDVKDITNIDIDDISITYK